MDTTIWDEFLICKESEFDIQLFYNAFKKNIAKNTYILWINFLMKNVKFNVRTYEIL